MCDSACQADYIVIGGGAPAEVMERYGTLTGFAPKFPEWAAGFRQSKLRCESQQTYVDVTNPGARRFLWEQVRRNYYAYGIRSFWQDQAEPEIHPINSTT